MEASPFRSFGHQQLVLEEFFFSDSAQSFSAKLHRCSDDFFRGFVNGFSLDGFSADASWKQPSFCAKGVGAVCYVAHFFSPSAPHSFSIVDRGVLNAFEGFTAGRTSFFLCQCVHNLLSFVGRTSISHVLLFFCKSVFTRFDLSFFPPNS